jgi:hypothetical protein
MASGNHQRLIFWRFICDERNNLVKEYQISKCASTPTAGVIRSTTAKHLYAANTLEQPALCKHRLRVSCAIDADEFIAHQVHDQNVAIGLDRDIER